MNKSQIKAMLAGVCTDITRPHICGVLYKKTRFDEDHFNIELTSTDGHVLFHLTIIEGSAELIPDTFEPQSCIIPTEILKLAVASQKSKHLPSERMIRVSEDSKEIIVDDTITIPIPDFTRTEEDYPKWQNVMVKPTNDGYLGTIRVDILKQVIEFSKIADSKITGISFWLGKSHRSKHRKLGETAYAVRICGLYQKDSAEIVVMPLRDDDAAKSYPDTEKCQTCRFNQPAHDDIPQLCTKITICDYEPIQEKETVNG